MNLDPNLVAFIDGSLDGVKEYVDQKLLELRQLLAEHEALMHGKGAGDNPDPAALRAAVVYADLKGGAR